LEQGDVAFTLQEFEVEFVVVELGFNGNHRG
jgi:hypothetical protein